MILNRDHVGKPIELGLVEMRDDNPVLTIAEQNNAWERQAAAFSAFSALFLFRNFFGLLSWHRDRLCLARHSLRPQTLMIGRERLLCGLVVGHRRLRLDFSKNFARLAFLFRDWCMFAGHFCSVHESPFESSPIPDCPLIALF